MAVSQLAQLASSKDLSRQGLNVMAELQKLGGPGQSKLPGDRRTEQPVRLPVRESHGRYSTLKQQAGFDLYVESCKSLEATAKALAIR